MKAIIEVTKAFFKLFLRDKVNLFFTFLFNILLMSMLGLSVRDKYSIDVTIGMADEANSLQSQQLIAHLQNQPNLTLVPLDRTELIERIRLGKLVVGVVIEKGFGETTIPIGAATAEHPKIKILGDKSREMWAMFLKPAILQALIETEPALREFARIVSVQIQAVQSHNLNYFDFVFPGMLAFSIMQLCLGSGLILLSYRKRDVLKRLKVTPLTRLQFLTGFSLSRSLLLVTLVVLFFLIAKFLFEFQMQGNWLQLAFVLALGAILFTALGLLVAGLAPSIESGNMLVRFMTFPAAFLCGVFFPLDSFPSVLEWLARAIPLTYFVDATRSITNYGLTLWENSINIFLLLFLVVIAIVWTSNSFRWEDQPA